MQNILFITSSRIGDAVLSTGLLDYLIKLHPHSRITVAVGRIPAELFQSFPNVNRVLTIDKRKFGLHWLSVWKKCFGTKWAIVVDLRSGGISTFLRSESSFIFRSQRRARKYIIFGARQLSKNHRLEEMAKIFNLRKPPNPKIFVSEKDCEYAKNIIPKKDLVLAFGPTANWIAKKWRTERFLQLAQKLIRKNGLFEESKIVIFGLEHERESIGGLINSLPKGQVIDLVGKVNLRTAYACLERCKLFVGNDSGLMHLAAASGIPTIGLFGPSRIEHYRPWGEFTGVASTKKTLEELSGYDGFKVKNTEALSGDQKLSLESIMDSLSVNEVEKVIRNLWKKVKESSG